MANYSHRSLINWNKFEDTLDEDTRYADPTADDFKNGDDAVDFIRQYIGSGWHPDDFYKENIRQIQKDEKHHEWLYTDNENTTAFVPVKRYISVQDFKHYDLMLDPVMIQHFKDSRIPKGQMNIFDFQFDSAKR